MNRTAAAGLMLAGILFASTVFAQTCPPAGMSREQLVELKSHDFAVADDARRQALALELLDCLGNPDPQLRDGIAFEALAAWMRGKQLSPATVGKIRERLIPQLDASYFQNPQGVLQPFAALVLAEVARFDRVEPFMTDQQLQQLVDAGTGYLRSVKDYRGFDERIGWRHGVAHCSDLMLQLADVQGATRSDAGGDRHANCTSQRSLRPALLRVRRRRPPRAGGVLHRKAQAAHRGRVAQVARAGCRARAAGKLARCVRFTARSGETPQHDGVSVVAVSVRTRKRRRLSGTGAAVARCGDQAVVVIFYFDGGRET
jgi:hypothetical protein